jgi:hypothetical protein
MSEEGRPVHTQEPAEGADENVEAPGAERSGDPSNPETAEEAGGQQGSPHPQEPAEGGEDDAEAPGADKPSNSG